MITIEVQGTPAPKGSARALLIRGRPTLVPGGSNANRTAIQLWSRAVKAASIEAIAFAIKERPINVEITFRLARPAGHTGARGRKPSAPAYPAGKPDVDKLVRCTLDAMTGVAFDDDSRIVQIVARKLYADHAPPGATIMVGAA